MGTGSVRKRADGTMAVFPHFIMDRGKPGTMVVDQQGRRFMNETLSYHRFGHAMRVAHANAPSIRRISLRIIRRCRNTGWG